MSKKARLARALRRRMMREYRNNVSLKDLEQDFLDFLCYGMIIKRIDKDGNEETLIPKMEE